VIMDNLRSHKVAGVREAIEAGGGTLMLLPPYNPDLNPIEMAFAKLKMLLRAKAIRTVEALWSGTGTIVGCFTPKECVNYFCHDGYFQSVAPARAGYMALRARWRRKARFLGPFRNRVLSWSSFITTSRRQCSWFSPPNGTDRPHSAALERAAC
jgi:hypothetical protein